MLKESCLDVLALKQLYATDFFADGGNEDNCILLAIKEVINTSPEDVMKSCIKVMELLDFG